MLTAKDFFAAIPDDLAPLLPPEEPVWTGLARLAGFLAHHPVAELPAELADGRPLPGTVVLHQGAAYTDGLEIHWGDATKGNLRVLRHGAILDGATVLMAGAVLMGRRIGFGRGCLVEAGALVREPALFGDHTEVRQGAYVRGNCVTARRCVVGHATEVKNALFLDDAKAGHFAYVGDSILGNRVNLGAGTKLANLRFLAGSVQVRTPKGSVDTGLRKLGAILGDDVQTGCNAVTSPGTLLAPKSLLFPNVTAASGLHPRGATLRSSR